VLGLGHLVFRLQENVVDWHSGADSSKELPGCIVRSSPVSSPGAGSDPGWFMDSGASPPGRGFADPKCPTFHVPIPCRICDMESGRGSHSECPFGGSRGALGHCSATETAPLRAHPDQVYPLRAADRIRSSDHWPRAKVSTNRPADITAIRSHTAMSSRRSDDTITMALPDSASSESNP